MTARIRTGYRARHRMRLSRGSNGRRAYYRGILRLQLQPQRPPSNELEQFRGPDPVNDDRLVPDTELDYDSDLVCTLNGVPFSGTAFEESSLLGRSEITFHDGLQEGPARDWYPSGVLKGESQFVQGTLHGTVKEFRPDGALAEVSRYEYGVLVFRLTLAADGSVIEAEEVDASSDEADLLQRLRRDCGWPT